MVLFVRIASEFISHSVCKTVLYHVFLRVCVSYLRAKYGVSARLSCFERRALF